MYKIKDADGNILTQTDNPRFVKKKPSTGVWIQSNAEDAQCLAIDGIRYSIAGRELVEDAPIVVTIEQIENALESFNQHTDIENLSFAVNKIAEEVIEMFSQKL